MTKEPLKSLIRRKFLSKQNEHSANISEHWNEFSMFTSDQCVNIRKLPNSLNVSPDQEGANRLLAELDLSQVRERYYTGNAGSPAHSSTADKKRPGSQGQEAPANRTASISLPADNRPQGDMLKELLLPFQPWPVTLAHDCTGHIQIKASRLLLSQMQAFLKSRPGHAWSTMRKS